MRLTLSILIYLPLIKWHFRFQSFNGYIKWKLSSSGLSDMEISIRTTWPDKCLPNRKIVLYLDGDKVHDLDNLWDRTVDETLRRRGWTVLRERYHMPITQQRLKEIVSLVADMLK